MHFEGAHIRMYFLLFRSRLAYNVKVLYVKGLYVKATVYGIPSLDLICKCRWQAVGASVSEGAG